MDSCCQLLIAAVPLVILAAFFAWVVHHKEQAPEERRGTVDEAGSPPAAGKAAAAGGAVATEQTDIPGTEDDRGPAASWQPDPNTLLASEFEYARVTASEALEDRARMINFYFAIFGVSVTGALAMQQGGFTLPPYTGTALLWTLYVLGWIYFLILIQLRKAWSNSLKTMNWMKRYFFELLDHPVADPREDEGPAGRSLRDAFRWQWDTIPPADRPFTVFFYSNLLIALLNSLSYTGGIAFLFWEQSRRASAVEIWAPAAVLGIASLSLQMFFWRRMLRE